MFFTAVIFTVLWLLQTVFLQRFYDGMIIKNTVAAADSIESQFGSSLIAGSTPAAIAMRTLLSM